jgi:hypothetical protein
MSNRTEIVLHWAAAVNTVVLGLLAFLPQTARQVPAIDPPWSYLFGAVFGVTLAGFHFWMLIECARGGRWTAGRIFWLIFLLLLPIASALVYFMFTRSGRYDAALSARSSSS